jgi:flavin-dependent dehydrogenase
LRDLKTYDVIVMGGGPAGSVAARYLASAGCLVALLEKSDFHLPRVGEMLSPEGHHALARLGLWDTVAPDCCREVPGVLSLWGDAIPRSQDFICNPLGPAWALDRAGFDERLFASAGDKAAELFPGWHARAVDHDAEGWTILATHDSGATREWRTRMLVNAAGRGAPLNSPGRRRVRSDLQVALVGRFLRENNEVPGDPRLIIEATEQGWCYALSLPRGRAVATLFTDPDLARSSTGRTSFFSASIRRTTIVAKHVCKWIPVEDIVLTPAECSVAANPVGYLALAIGDAAMTVDPLCGHGIAHAIDSAINGAEAILSFFAGRHDALDEFANRTAAIFAHHHRQKIRTYGLERRWPRSIYWSRRFFDSPSADELSSEKASAPFLAPASV